jgi:predicted metal-binding membrane protein
MSGMQASSAATTALMTVAMMVAMMLPSIVPTVWRYHRRLRAMRTPRARRRTTVFVAGYASVWTAISLALFAMSTVVSATPFVAGVVLLCAGALQRSRWKANQLVRCRTVCVSTRSWRDGWQLGVDCGLSCSAPMAVLFVSGLMDARMMVAIAAAITAERVAPVGQLVARATGALALIAGFVIATG